MAARIGAVNRIAREERDLDTSLVPKEYLVETSRSPIPAEFGATKKRLPLEGFLFPATYEFTPRTTSKQLVDLQLAAFRRAWEQIDLTYAEERNLTPYDVLIIASMIEAEVRVPKERALVAAVIYNRLRAGMTTRDRRGDPLRARHPPGRAHHAEPARHAEPLQHAPEPRPAADSDRQPGARVDEGGGEAGRRRLPLLRAQDRTARLTSSPRARPSSTRFWRARGASPDRSHDAARRHPRPSRLALALAADAERRVRRRRARLGLRPASLRAEQPWRRRPWPRRGRFRGRERHDPAQDRGARVLRRGRRRRVARLHRRIPSSSGTAACSVRARTAWR